MFGAHKDRIAETANLQCRKRMIQSLQEGTNHKYFKALALGLSQFHICWLQGTHNASPCATANAEGSNRGRRALLLWTSNYLEPPRWALEVCPSVEVRQLMRDDPEANQQFSLLSNEELTSCSLCSCPSSAGQWWAVIGCLQWLWSRSHSGLAWV